MYNLYVGASERSALGLGSWSAVWGFLKIRGTLLQGFYWGYIGIVEKKMDTTIQGLGFWVSQN